MDLRGAVMAGAPAPRRSPGQGAAGLGRSIPPAREYGGYRRAEGRGGVAGARQHAAM